MYLGKRGTPYYGDIVCRGIHRAMKSVYKNVNVNGNITSVWLKYTEDGLINDPTTYIEYPDCLTHTIARCTNIYANRGTNWCSHCIGGVLFFRLMYHDLKIPVPTPHVNERFKHLTNISSWVKLIDKMDYEQRQEYWEDMITNSSYLFGGEQFQVKNMWNDDD